MSNHDDKVKKHYMDILNEGSLHMDKRNYSQARDKYEEVANSAAPSDIKEMAEKFADGARESIENRKRLFD